MVGVAQIGQRPLLRLAGYVVIALAQQDRRRRRPIRHGLDEHGRIESQTESRRKSFTWTQNKNFSGRKAREILGFQVTINENFGLVSASASFSICQDAIPASSDR